MEWLASCDYNIEMPANVNLNQVILFPNGEPESRGMEDMRLVRFTHDDGSMCYYGTYAAFNGWRTRLQLLEMPGVEVDGTTGSLVVQIRSLQGRGAKDRGLALFPRTVNGHYLVVGRSDGENLYLLKSRDIRVWERETTRLGALRCARHDIPGVEF
ncbi:MAG: hypothetical protein MUC88_02485 [Planctomycetes bacterium]|nr:hypothetical protein [Planctomycetota bacterium]